MMKGNKKIYFPFFLTIIQIGIEVVIKVQNLTKTIFVVETGIGKYRMFLEFRIIVDYWAYLTYKTCMYLLLTSHWQSHGACWVL